MNKCSSILKKCKQNKSAFTLIELIVVLVILGIILAITVPAVTSYIDEAKDVTDDINISILNKSTQAYKVYLYNELGEVPKDTFYDLDNDDSRQQRLLDRNLLDEKLESTRGATYNWDVPSQKWVKNYGSGGGSADGMDSTILRDIFGKSEEEFEEWKAGNYKNGDIVKIKDKSGKTLIFKWIGKEGYVGSPPTDKNIPFWKEISLDYDKTNCYEKGDIIQYTGDTVSGIKNKFFKAVADNPEYGNAYTWAGCHGLSYCPPNQFDENKVFDTKDKDGNPVYFQEVEYKNGKWVDVVK